MYRVFFLFKQKTAYDMRISDWSSDVCSSDLKQSMTERHQAGIAEQKIEPEQDDSVGEGREHERNVVRRNDEGSGNQDEQHRHDGYEDMKASHSIGFPNSPVGLKINMPITIR